MNKNKIYQVINQLLDSYVIEGVSPQQFLTYLNTDETNFKLIYHKIYRKLTMENISFESKELTEYLVDSIRDKIALLNDLKQGKPELPETVINQFPANTVNEGWKENLIVALSLFTSVALGQTNHATIENKPQIEQVKPQVHSAILGYLDQYSNQIINDSQNKPEMTEAIKEVRLYAENMRDGQGGTELSKTAKALLSTIATQLKGSNNIQDFIAKGEHINH
jgi:hypothetical protein